MAKIAEGFYDSATGRIKNDRVVIIMHQNSIVICNVNYFSLKFTILLPINLVWGQLITIDLLNFTGKQCNSCRIIAWVQWQGIFWTTSWTSIILRSTVISELQHGWWEPWPWRECHYDIWNTECDVAAHGDTVFPECSPRLVPQSLHGHSGPRLHSHTVQEPATDPVHSVQTARSC